MIQLIPISIDDKALYNSIAIKKQIRHDHCSYCQNTTQCETCEFSNRFKMQRISGYIFDRYDYYQVHSNTLNAIVPEGRVSKDEEKLLRDAYEKSADFKVVRKAIMESLPAGMRGKCPFCMISEPNTLEHYFPETTYPEYIIFSPNLVPCCSKCNSLKGEEILKNGHRMALHYYFDQIPTEQFIFASIAVTDGIPVISFDIKTDNLDEIGIIIANQFKKLQLLDRYKEQCNDELSSLYNEMIEYYTMSNSIDTCISILTVRINSLQKIYGKNYWKVCLYKALSMAPETFQEFLSYSSFNN